MNQIVIPTSFNIELEFTSAPFAKRLLAWVIDFIILLVYSVIVKMSLQSGASPSTGNLSAQYNLSFLMLILYTPALLYHLVCELYLNGQSVGKRIMGLQVISEDGKRPATYQYLLRWLLRMVDMGLTLGFAAFMFSVTTRKGQRLGDMAAGTLVIDRKRGTSLTETIFQEVPDNYQPKYPAVLKLSDADLNIIKATYETCRRTRNYEHAHRIGNKIRLALNIESISEDEIDFLETILTDYNFLSTKD